MTDTRIGCGASVERHFCGRHYGGLVTLCADCYALALEQGDRLESVRRVVREHREEMEATP